MRHSLLLAAFLLAVAASSLGAVGSARAQGAADPELMQRRAARMERQLAMGRAQTAAGHSTLALRHFEDALRENPASPEPYLELGRTYLALRRVADAVTILEAGRHRAPDDTSLVAALADALMLGAREQDALRLLREATRRHRAHVGLLAQRGELAQRIGAWSEAADANAALLDLARRGEPVPAEVLEAAQQTLRALGIVMGDGHPRAHGCEAPRPSVSGRWARALAACDPP